MELAADGARQLGESPLDVEVDVLELPPEGEAALRELGVDGVETRGERAQLSLGEEPRAPQRARPCTASLDVVRPEPAVEAERGGERLRAGVQPLRESTAPARALRALASAHARSRARSPAISVMTRPVMSTRSPRVGARRRPRCRGWPKRTDKACRRGR